MSYDSYLQYNGYELKYFATIKKSYVIYLFLLLIYYDSLECLKLLWAS